MMHVNAMGMNPVHTMQATLINWFQTDNPIVNYMITFSILTGMTLITTHASKLYNIVTQYAKRFFRRKPLASVKPSLKFCAYYSESKSWSGSNEFFAWLEEIKAKALPPMPQDRPMNEDGVFHLEQFGTFYFSYSGGNTVWIPSENMDFYLDNNIWISFERNVTQEGENKDKKINVTLTVYVKSIEHFSMLLKYHEKLVVDHMEKQNRKFNEPHIWRYSGYEESGRIRWKNYKFNSTRSFDHVWFKEKEKFLDAYRHFRNCRDDYRETGDPWFFSALFYGPPGCGKTSTIKAILEESKKNKEVCHLFLVPFKSITSADMLLNLLHNELVENINIPFDQRIYIFEDFDAENGAEMLKKRKFNNNNVSPYMSGGYFSPHRGGFGYIMKRGKGKGFGYDCDSEEEDGEEEKQNSIEEKEKKGDSNISDTKKKEEEETEHESRSAPVYNLKISLADILNAIDGVQELYGHTLIFTTNCPHPKKTFDSAFLREGRMHHIIKLGKCDNDGIDYFFKKRYGEACPSDLIDEIGCEIYTPAQIKSACNIYTSAKLCGDFLIEMKRKTQEEEEEKTKNKSKKK